MYEFKVRFSNDRMGFQKSFTVVALDAAVAVEAAYVSLEAAGYKRGDFMVIGLERGRKEGT